jgi:hypothetical protein
MDIRKLVIALGTGLIGLMVVSSMGVIPSDTAVASPGFATEDLTGALTPDDLANTLVGTGVSISNVTYTGADVAAGRFVGGTGIIDFEDGVILSSGSVANVVGPNVEDGKTTVNSTPGDADLDVLSGFTTYDAAVLEFDFVPDADTVFFQYVFASDEYNEFVHSPFNDTFAFFINGWNCALVPETTTPVSINTINNGDPYGSLPAENPGFYINNDLSDGGGVIDTEMDGLTVTLTCEAPVVDGGSNHVKLAIADASDRILDAVVFIKAGSFSTEDPDVIAVAVDIKPQSCRNPVNVGDKGVLPAAILGTDEFDVSQIDPATVQLEGVSPIRWALEDVATPFEPYIGKEDALDCNTCGPDGYLDLTLKFDTQAIVAALGSVNDRDVLVLELTGNLKPEFGGTFIAGEDVVVILK